VGEGLGEETKQWNALESSVDIRDLHSLVRHVCSTPSKTALHLVDDVLATDWTRHHWLINNENQLRLGSLALAHGVPVFHAFGNFYALTFHPHPVVMLAVNACKGRPPTQIASVTTSAERVKPLFDWEGIPSQWADPLQNMMERLQDLGPIGFRGPASRKLIGKYPHLIDTQNQDAIQVIVPGKHCPSNNLFRQAMAMAGVEILAITSANVSKHLHAGAEQPAHYRMEGIQGDFGARKPGFVLLGHGDESMVGTRYPRFRPTSTSILSWARGKSRVRLERQGSLSLEILSRELEDLNMELEVAESARICVPEAIYSPVLSL
jgi:hypothetical protein